MDAYIMLFYIYHTSQCKEGQTRYRSHLALFHLRINGGRQQDKCHDGDQVMLVVLLFGCLLASAHCMHYILIYISVLSFTRLDPRKFPISKYNDI